MLLSTKGMIWQAVVLLLCLSCLKGASIRLSTGITLETNKRTSLLNYEKSPVDFQAKYAKYGFKENKVAQFFVELKENTKHEEIEKILGKAETIIDDKIAIYTTAMPSLNAISSKLRFVGLVKPHYKFSAMNLIDTKKPFDHLVKISKEEKFSFNVILSQQIGIEQIAQVRNDLQNGFYMWKKTQNFDNYDVNLVAEQGSNNIRLELIPIKNIAQAEAFSVYDQVLSYFAQRPEIVYIERHIPSELLNIEAYVVLQSNYRPITGKQTDLLYRNGITGKNQIVQVTDTGLDTGNCLFHDKSNPKMVFNQTVLNHRKIAGYYYNVGSDSYDSAGGHGTHVAGSVGGSLDVTDPEELRDRHGVAPDAKIFMYDVGNENTGALGGIYLDVSLNFQPGYLAGARIFTNSWSTSNAYICTFDCSCTDGSGNAVTNAFCISQTGRSCCRTANKYMTQTQYTDKFLFDNPEAIALFSAGNDGRKATNATVKTPCIGKNTVCVGASSTKTSDYMNSVDFYDFTSELAQVKAAGYSTVTNETTCCSYTGFNQAQIRSFCCGTEIKNTLATLGNYYNASNLAGFSSRGPAFDEPNIPTSLPQRIKPDIVAPGERLVSAHGDGNPNHGYHCGTQKPLGANSAALTVMQGTSMSTPALAGGVALIRQYFSENLGRFLHKNAANELSVPSGVLLKALVIHSGQLMPGVVSLDGVTSKITKLPQYLPNIQNGFGLSDLSFILPMQNEQRAGNQPFFDMRVENFKKFTKVQTQPNNYSFKLMKRLENSGKFAQYFKATLTWYDYPSNPLTVTTDTILEADLDLVVTVPSKSKTYYGNNVATGDKVNTVEQIIIPEADLLSFSPEEEIIVTVKKGVSGRFNPDYVPYSIVVSSTYGLADEKSAALPLFNLRILVIACAMLLFAMF